MGVGKSRSQEIDEEAIEVLKQHFPKSAWTVYDMKPDFGIDHRLERVEEGKHTAKTALIQLKGHERLVPSGKDGTNFTYMLECEHLGHYLKGQEPVFLVLVDVGKRDAYWQFVQRYADRHLKDKDSDWRQRLANKKGSKKPRVAIKVPVRNSLRDLEKFTRAFEESIGYIAHSRAAKGIKHRQDSLKSLDPRFDVKLLMTEDTEHYSLQPLTDVSVKLNFHEPFVTAGKLETLLGRGLPVTIEAGEVTVEGSDLLTELLNDTAHYRGALRFNRNWFGLISFIRINAAGQEVGRFPSIPCRFEGGEIECRFIAEVQNGLFTVSSSFRIDAPPVSDAVLKYDFRHWRGWQILNLPYFSSIHSLFGDLKEGDRLRLVFQVKGRQIPGATIQWHGADYKSIGDFVDVVHQARLVAEKYRVNPVIRKLSERDVNEIEAIYALSNGGEISTPSPDARIESVVTEHEREGFFAAYTSNAEPYRLIYLTEAPIPFMGTDLEMGLLERQLSHMVLADDLDEVRRKFAEGASEVRVAFVGTEQTLLIIKVPSQETIAGFNAQEGILAKLD
jgi:hypothetical protein